MATERGIILLGIAPVVAYHNAVQNLAIKPPMPRPITVQVYHLMAERGAFHPDERVELVGGQVFDMSPIGTLHARCVNFLANFLTRGLGETAIVSSQNPITLDDLSESQPDIAVLAFREDFFVYHQLLAFVMIAVLSGCGDTAMNASSAQSNFT